MSLLRSVTSILCLSLCLTQRYSYAQDKSKIQFGKVTSSDFNSPPSPLVDSNSHDVTLLSAGDLHFVGNNHNWFSYVYKVHKRIRIVDKEAIGVGTVEIHLYDPEGQPELEKVDDISAITYNLENGKIVETRMEKSDIFRKRASSKWIEVKFTLPAMKEGSIIEYQYTKTSPFDNDLPDWEFQSEIGPVLWSELDVEVPQTLSYIVLKQGIHPFDVDEAGKGSQTYKVQEKFDNLSLASTDERSSYVTTSTLKHKWVMKNNPVLHVENFLNSPRNYIDKLQFQLSGTYNGEEKSDVANTWKAATDEWLGNSFYFGTINDDNDWLNDLADQLTKDAAGQLAQAKAIYYYVNSHFVCNNHNDPFVGGSLKEVLQKHSGTVGGINALMLVLLRKKNIQADPVLLSTTSHGYNFVKYPIQDRMNYSIVRAVIAGKVFYLDATHPYLGFGQLAPDCYNGPARIISNTDSGFVSFNADSLHENSTTMVIVSNGEKGLEGSYQRTMGPQESYNLRERIAKEGQKKYFSDMQTRAGGDTRIMNTGIDSLDRPEDPVMVHYEFAFRSDLDKAMIYFTPMMTDAYTHNPFQAADRHYPVERSSCLDETFILNMDIPAGYGIEEMPKSVKVALNGTEGAFEYLVASDGKTIQLRSRVTLNRALFMPDDYASLRDFFAFIVKQESEQIVLKKK